MAKRQFSMGGAMKFSDLKGRPVVDIGDSKKIGELLDIFLDASTHKPVGMKVRTGLFSQPLTVSIDRLKSVGEDAVTVAGETPQATQAIAGDQAPPVLQEPLEATSIIGNKVITDTGTLVGEVQDLLIDPAALAITGYEVKAGGLFTRPQEIDITPEVRHGENLITVPASLLS